MLNVQDAGWGVAAENVLCCSFDSRENKEVEVAPLGRLASE
jgi:hypothetical protein